MFKSIRWRLLAWHAGILVLTVAGFGATLAYQIRNARLGEVDAELLVAARALEATLRQFPPHVLEGVDAPPGKFPESPPLKMKPPPKKLDDKGKPPPKDWPPPKERPPPKEKNLQDWERSLMLPNPESRRFGDDPDAAMYFTVWLGDGKVFKSSKLPQRIGTPAYDFEATADPGHQEIREHGEFREVVLAGPRRSQILVGRSISREQRELEWFRWQLVGTGLAVLTVGLAGGFWLSGRAVRPIAAMSTAAATISVSSLDRRIDVGDVDSELGKLASILNEMFARLEAAFERQARFTADASHELRTPLSIVHSSAELALNKPRTNEELREALETCVRASRRMKSIVEGLLTLARADAGKLELVQEPIDLGKVVQEAVAMVEPLAAQKKVDIRVHAPPLNTTGDASRVAQVVTNLVSNAISYNRIGGSVSVMLQAEGQTAVLCVADTGCGIPDEDRPQIFERFYRVDKARAREQGGSGLGLAICKSIIEGMGGTIGFTTAVNRGTQFVARWPLRPRSPAAPDRAPPSGDGAPQSFPPP
jgi:heavy metal sensor kinase